MGNAKSVFMQEPERAFQPFEVSVVPGPSSFTAKQELKASLHRMLEVLRFDITDQPGALCPVTGDYTPGICEILDQIELISLKIKAL